MAAISLQFDTKALQAKIKAIAQVKAAVMPVAYKFFVAHTPIRSGNARSKTALNNNVINANYPYASNLDAGRSKQAPQGMTKPTEDEIKRLAAAYIKQNGLK